MKCIQTHIQVLDEYINDLPNCLSLSSASMFADDTNISTQGKTDTEIQERLNTDLELSNVGHY